jgi:hypothetical protein
MGIDSPDYLDEEPASPQEIADACRDVLDEETCEEIALQESPEEALELAFTALEEAGEDPEAFLRERGILE